jgi:2-acylglycerol O-acyltransferase 2
VGSFHDRFMQKLALSLIMLCLIGPFIYWPLAIGLFLYNPLYGIVRAVIVLYLAWIFIIDKDAHNQPRGMTPIRRLSIWRHLAAYFPATLIKTTDIDPKANYIFCGHPHGIACFSYVANFFVEGTGFSQLFPGINLFPIILDAHFFAPIHREVSLWSGFRGSSKQAFVNLLKGAGNSVFLVPGGAPEVMKVREASTFIDSLTI